METLVIHPDDRSTDFLKIIYEGKGYTVITDRITCRNRKVISDLIEKHDRIIMMGHGHPYGLFFTCIDPEMVYLLREKNTICIWCNADKFVERYNLRGFYTGMFVSEVAEGYYFNIKTTQEKVNYSNNLFSYVMSELIDYPIILEEVKTHYNGDCPVIKFNNSRLYYRAENKIVKSSSNVIY